MATTYTDLPSELGSGTTVEYTRTLSDYPANDGWAMHLYLAGKQVLDITASASGASFLVGISAAQSATLGAGVYSWVERMSKAGKVYDVGSGHVTVTPNIATATAGSMQLHLEKALELIEARIEERVAAGHDLESYHSDSLGVVKVTLKDLIDERSRLKEQVNAIAAGGTFSRPVLIRFVGAGIR